jgi:hypothetical protein
MQNITCASIFTLGILGSTQMEAAYLSEANLYSTIFEEPRNETIGGTGVSTAEFSRTGSAIPVAGVSQNTSGWTIASAETGRLAFRLESAIDVATDAAVASAASANIQSTNNTVFDDFTIGAGGGLVNGDAAQIRLQIQLDGEYQLQGRPAGGLHYAFSLRAGEGTTNLPEVAVFDTGGIYETVTDEFHEFWDLVFDVTVGSTFRVNTSMSGWINGTGFDRGESGLNYLNVDPIFRVSNAEGYDLNIVSSAGAPISAIPVPTAAWLFGSGLLGLVGVARRKQ